MKPVLVLTLFLFCIITNAVMANAHSLDADSVDPSHGSNDSAHIHLSDEDHQHSSDELDEEHGAHDEAHVHICFHFIPWSSTVSIGSPSKSSKITSLAFDYLGLTYTPPVPPPTA